MSGGAGGIIDLTRVFDSNMPVYPGDPTPELKQIAFFSEHGYNDFKIHSGMHVGTHMDAPLHFVDGGRRMSEIDPQQFIGSGRLIDARKKKTVGVELLNKTSVNKGDILLVWTGFGARFGEPDYFVDYPVIEVDFAKKAVDLGVKIVGMDTPSPDKEPFEVHKILLDSNVLIIENLTNLEQLQNLEAFEVIALPAKFKAEAAPARVIARCNK